MGDPRKRSSPVPPLHEKAPNFFPPLGCSSRSRAVGQPEPVPVSACFQPESRSSQAPIALKLPFHIHMPYFSQVASINGSAQTPVLKIRGFQRNPSEELGAGSDECGARRDPRGSPATAAPSPAGAALSRGLSPRVAPAAAPGPASRDQRSPPFRPRHTKVLFPHL